MNPQQRCADQQAGANHRNPDDGRRSRAAKPTVRGHCGILCGYWMDHGTVPIDRPQQGPAGPLLICLIPDRTIGDAGQVPQAPRRSRHGACPAKPILGRPPLRAGWPIRSCALSITWSAIGGKTGCRFCGSRSGMHDVGAGRARGLGIQIAGAVHAHQLTAAQEDHMRGQPSAL
jgi:hypothetical protein